MSCVGLAAMTINDPFVLMLSFVVRWASDSDQPSRAIGVCIPFDGFCPSPALQMPKGFESMTICSLPSMRSYRDQLHRLESQPVLSDVALVLGFSHENTLATDL